MISIIITSYNEPKTIEKAVLSVYSQINNSKGFEIIIVAPDKATIEKANQIASKIKIVRVLKDKGKGKSDALNLAVRNARGSILILTDGDVYVGPNSIKKLLEQFHNDKVGAVTGKPVSVNERNNKYGFWAYSLTKVADERRLSAKMEKKECFCSGYLFAIKKILFPKLPENLLSEDGYISHIVYRSGHLIDYAPEATVFVKYPNNFSDWMKQKKRSAGGYNQIRKMLGVNIRSFGSEASGGLSLMKYVSNIRDLFWLFELYFARIYLWLVIYRDINLRNKGRKELWKRVDSTK